MKPFPVFTVSSKSRSCPASITMLMSRVFGLLQPNLTCGKVLVLSYLLLYGKTIPNLTGLKQQWAFSLMILCMYWAQHGSLLLLAMSAGAVSIWVHKRTDTPKAAHSQGHVDSVAYLSMSSQTLVLHMTSLKRRSRRIAIILTRWLGVPKSAKAVLLGLLKV